MCKQTLFQCSAHKQVKLVENEDKNYNLSSISALPNPHFLAAERNHPLPATPHIPPLSILNLSSIPEQVMYAPLLRCLVHMFLLLKATIPLMACDCFYLKTGSYSIK